MVMVIIIPIDRVTSQEGKKKNKKMMMMMKEKRRRRRNRGVYFVVLIFIQECTLQAMKQRNENGAEKEEGEQEEVLK